MRILNRNVVILRPKQPYVDWANALDDGPPFDPAEEPEGGTAYLVPEAATVEEIRAFVVRHGEEMFEHELDAWHTDRAAWPRNRSYTMLQEWFEIEIHSMVVDLGAGPLRADEY
jgi:hypothetical protein